MASRLPQLMASRNLKALQLADAMRAAAARLGVPVAGRASLRVMISRWENGHAQPDARNLFLLQQALGVPGDCLGFADVAASPGWDSGHAVSGSRMEAAVTDELVDYFTAQLAAHAAMDNASGPFWVAGTVEVQLIQLLGLAESGAPEATELAARYAELLGWLMHDAGDHDGALRHTQRAVDLAESTSNRELAVYAVMRKSNVLTSAGERHLALSSAKTAVVRADREAPDLAAVCLRQLAVTQSHVGDERAAMAASDAALRLAEMGSSSLASSYCTVPYLEMERALCWLVLGKPVQAAAACTSALREWPAHLVRDESLCLARLAVACAQLGQLEEACDAAVRSLERVRSAPSARSVHMLRAALKRLEPCRRNRMVRELADRLAEVA